MKLGITKQGFQRLAQLAGDAETEEFGKTERGKEKDTSVKISDVIQYFHANPNSSDSDLHDWAEENKFEVDDVEEMAYTLASALVEFLHNGKAYESGFTEDDADEDELAKGIEVESEHTSNPMMAKRIALDHLCEIEDYYSRLKKMEDEAKKGMK